MSITSPTKQALQKANKPVSPARFAGTGLWEYLSLLLLCSLMLFPGDREIHAQEKLSLKENISYAFEQNLQYRISILDTRQNKGDLKQNRLSRLPSLNASANQAFRYGRNVDPYTSTFVQQSIHFDTFSLSSSVPLFKGFQLTNRIKSSQYSLKAGKQDDIALKNTIRLQVTSYYLELLLQKEKGDNARSRKAITQQLQKKTRLLIESGKTNKTEALELEAQLASEQSQLVKANNQVKIARLNLRQYMNWTEEKTLRTCA